MAVKRKRVRIRSNITRAYVRAHPSWAFVFGDNIERTGFGGQAAEMRDEPNAIGVVTKRRPAMTPDAFLSDTNPTDLYLLMHDLTMVAHARSVGATIVLPKGGIGTGMAQLETRAPHLNRIVKAFMRALKETKYDP